jgi:hypothetical protein
VCARVPRLTGTGLLGVGGIYISLVMKHLDNLHKSFAQAIVIVLVFALSTLFMDAHVGMYFFVGAAVVCGAMVGYNSVDE